MTNKFFLAAALLAFTTVSAQAGTVSLVGGGALDVGTTSQTIQVLIDIAPENFSFADGSLGLSIATTTPGVIEITGADVKVPEFFGGLVKRWTAGSVTGLSAEAIDELLGISVQTAGLNSGVAGNPIDAAGSVFLFAEITYDVIGAGTTSVSVAPITSRDGAFLVSEGVDVSASINLQDAGSSFSVTGIDGIPEPSTAILAMLGLVGVAARRRS